MVEMRRLNWRRFGRVTPPSFVVLLALLLFASVAPRTANAAEEIPGAFKAPAVGTVYEYASSAGPWKVSVRGVDGMQVHEEFSKATESFKGEPNRNSYGWLIPMSLDATTEFDRRRVDRFFPLSVGGKVVVNYRNREIVGAGFAYFGRTRTITVLGTESIRVPAGEFFVYVVKHFQRQEGYRRGIERVIWYSPEVGLIVRLEIEIRGGKGSGQTAWSELTRIIDPEGKQLYPMPEPAVAAATEEPDPQPTVKLTAADGQKLFDAGDYAGASNTWFSAAQVGDALAMLKLGEAHEEGLGVPQSFLRAHLFFNLAAAKGDARARAARNLIAAKMTAQTLAEAQELADGWPESAKRLAK